MKICPKCNTQYTDDSLQFCLQDGTPLPDSISPSQFETVDLDEPETVIARKNPDRIAVNISEPEVKTWEADNTGSAAIDHAHGQTAEPKSKTWLAVLLTALVMMLLFGIGGVAAWFYLAKAATGDPTPAGNVAVKETPKANSKTPTPDPTQAPKIDSKQIAKDVGKQMSSWKALAESRNLKAYMSKYASRVDYYSKRRASRSFVESDKKKAFSDYTSIKSRFTNINIKPSKDGKSATATFDKEWDFSGPQKKTTGKVRSRLIFRKFGNKWLISSEKDLKVYYVNKS